MRIRFFLDITFIRNKCLKQHHLITAIIHNKLFAICSNIVVIRILQLHTKYFIFHTSKEVSCSKSSNLNASKLSSLNENYFLFISRKFQFLFCVTLFPTFYQATDTEQRNVRVHHGTGLVVQSAHAAPQLPLPAYKRCNLPLVQLVCLYEPEAIRCKL